MLPKGHVTVPVVKPSEAILSNHGPVIGTHIIYQWETGFCSPSISALKLRAARTRALSLQLRERQHNDDMDTLPAVPNDHNTGLFRNTPTNDAQKI